MKALNPRRDDQIYDEIYRVMERPARLTALEAAIEQLVEQRDQLDQMITTLREQRQRLWQMPRLHEFGSPKDMAVAFTRDSDFENLGDYECFMWASIMEGKLVYLGNGYLGLPEEARAEIAKQPYKVNFVIQKQPKYWSKYRDSDEQTLRDYLRVLTRETTIYEMSRRLRLNLPVGTIGRIVYELSRDGVVEPLPSRRYSFDMRIRPAPKYPLPVPPAPQEPIDGRHRSAAQPARSRRRLGRFAVG